MRRAFVFLPWTLEATQFIFPAWAARQAAFSDSSGEQALELNEEAGFLFRPFSYMGQCRSSQLLFPAVKYLQPVPLFGLEEAFPEDRL